MKPDLLPTDVQRVFLASKVNGALYFGESLGERPWEWPRGTFLQRRLEALRKKEANSDE